MSPKLTRDRQQSTPPPAAERPATAREPTPEDKLRAAQEQAAREAGLREARARLGQSYHAFLKRIDQVQKLKGAQLQVKTEADYQVWVSFFEMMKRQFKDLWDFLGLLDQEVTDWYRVAPNGGPWDFLGISREGYSFAAGIELNRKRNAPFPRKWLTVCLGHSLGGPNGIGDERMLGRKGAMDGKLVGLEHCRASDPEKQAEAAAELRRRAFETPLVFGMYSEGVGQEFTKVPVTVLAEHSLEELFQVLYAALNRDALAELPKLLPQCERLAIDYDGRKKGRS